MPIYEYRCADCRRRVSVFFRSFSAVGEPSCPRCGGHNLTRLVSKVAVRRGGGSADTDFADGGAMDGMLDGLDESDPRALARAMRQMSDEMGEPIEPEMAEALGRLEAGEDPDTVMAGLDEETEGGGEDDDF
jgi:putative FmdB family regulatory protein